MPLISEALDCNSGNQITEGVSASHAREHSGRTIYLPGEIVMAVYVMPDFKLHNKKEEQVIYKCSSKILF